MHFRALVWNSYKLKMKEGINLRGQSYSLLGHGIGKGENRSMQIRGRRKGNTKAIGNVKGKGTLLSVLKILLVMYIITGALLLLLTVLLSKLQLSEGTVSIGIVVIYVISGFLGGLLAGKKMKNRKFIWGMVMGACYFLVIVIGSILFHRGLDMEASRFVTTLILCIASGMVGGMVS